MLKNIAFFGSSELKPENKYYQQAFAIAQALAKQGYTVVNGGGPGIMNAATQGAISVDGETLTITFSPQDAPGFEGRYLANKADKEIKTNNYTERMFKLLEHADCFIIFKGGTGTLSEFSTAWVLAKLYYPQHKPFILYGRFWRKIIRVLKEEMLIPAKAMKVFKFAETEGEVLEALKNL
ncbi:LOG family protein [Patescibacteria group bacterium]|nr:LOG family protein [Patescibacteria group bacterium]